MFANVKAKDWNFEERKLLIHRIGV